VPSGRIHLGDVIIGLNDKPVRSTGDLHLGLDDKQPGDRVVLQVRRNEERLSLPLTLGRNVGADE
jgi:S1-C subfamily serine protease